MISGKKYEPDFVLVNENKIKVTSLSILILMGIYFFTGYWIIPAFLVIDFLVNAFNLSDYSILNIISINIVNFLNLEVKPVDEAPKKFASKIGLLLAVIILFLDLLNLTKTATAFAALLAIAAFLESVVGYCVGSSLYYWYKRISSKRSEIAPEET